MAFDRMGIDTSEVLDAAATKWNFLNFRPGLVGGHCIGVDPYYFIYEAKRMGYNSRLIAPGRQINNSMAHFVANKTIKLLVQAGAAPKKANVFIFGATFKEDCPDIRNSKVVDLATHLRSYNINPRIVDPLADPDEAFRIYGEALIPQSSVAHADCLIFAVAHNEFKKISLDAISRMFRQSDNYNEKIIIDIKSICDKESLVAMGYRYWRL